MLPKPIFCVFFSYTGILSLFIRYNDLFAGKTDTPFFCFGGDWWRVGLITNMYIYIYIYIYICVYVYICIYFFFWLREPFGRHVLR